MSETEKSLFIHTNVKKKESPLLNSTHRPFHGINSLSGTKIAFFKIPWGIGLMSTNRIHLTFVPLLSWTSVMFSSLVFCFLQQIAHATSNLSSDPIKNCSETFERLIAPEILKANHPPVVSRELPWVEMASGSLGDDREFGVRYYQDHERTVFKVFAYKGRLYDSFGNLLQSPTSEGPTGKLMFAMMQDGELYAYTKKAAETLGPLGNPHHSSVPGGTAVVTTGNWFVEEGVLKQMDNSSGHYGPPDATLDFALKRLEEMGIARPAVNLHGNKSPIFRKPSSTFNLAKNFTNLKEPEKRIETALTVLRSGEEAAIHELIDSDSRRSLIKNFPYNFEIKTRLMQLAQDPRFQKESIASIFILNGQNGWDFSSEMLSWRRDPQMRNVDSGVSSKLSETVVRHFLNKGGAEGVAIAKELVSEEATRQNPSMVLELFLFYKTLPGFEGMKGYQWAIKTLKEMGDNPLLDNETKTLARNIALSWLPKEELTGVKKRIRPGDLPKTHIKSNLPFIAAKKDKEYAGEATDILFRSLDHEQRESYHVGFVDGRAYGWNGELMDGKQPLIYVLGKDGEFYANTPEYGEFHHSSFFAGDEVYGAGEIRFENGIIAQINNSSGHYKITRKQFNLTIERLKEMGATFSGDLLITLNANTKD